MLSPILGDNQAPSVIGSIPAAGQFGVSSAQPVQVFFSKAVDQQKCIGAFSITQSVSGATIAPLVGGSTFVAGSVLTFSPSSTYPPGTYSISVSKNCEDEGGRDLLTPYNASFTVGSGGVQATPTVVAVGLESHGTGCSKLGSSGSSTGGDWTLSSCWWDSSLPVLGPSSYTFRGGDAGTGALGIPASCADVNTDNFVLIFNNYMNPNLTLHAVTLSRLSPPPTNISLGSWTWSDCQTVSPFGCRVLSVAYSELQATCNSTAQFGTIATGGDFNLGVTVGAPVGYPRYLIEVDTTATDVNGKNPTSNFFFAMEGK